MKFYLDSADLSALKLLMKTGVFYGVTTNPTLLKEAKVPAQQFPKFAAKVFDMGAKEIFLQSWGKDADELFAHGKKLGGIASNVIVKLPATREGFEAAGRLVNQGIATCITAVYAPFQALLADSLGAAYVAPYLGRMNDAGRDGHALIAQMAETLAKHNSSTEILAASVRSPEEAARLAQNGVRCITVSPSVAEKLFQEELSIAAAKVFEIAAQSVANEGLDSH